MPMATTPSPISPFPTAQETEYAHHQSVHPCAPAAAARCCRSGYIHAAGRGLCRRPGHPLGRNAPADPGDRKSVLSGKRLSVSVDLDERRTLTTQESAAILTPTS